MSGPVRVRRYRVTAHWYGKRPQSFTREVDLTDAAFALDEAWPAQWQRGDFDSADIRIELANAPATPAEGGGR